MSTIAIVFPQWTASSSASSSASFSASSSASSSEDPDAAFETVVRAVSDAVPLVHVRGTGTILMRARGPARFHGSVESAVAHLWDVCRGTTPARLGIGVAGGQFAATVAAQVSARSGAPEIIPAEQTGDFLAGLPVRWLALDDRVDPDHIGVLERLGLASLAAVRALGERALSDRFGAAGARVHRLARGEDSEPLVARAAPEIVSTRWRRDPGDPGLGGVDETTEAARDACDEMFARLESAGRQCTAVRITVVGDGGVRSDRVWHEPRGFSARAVLARLSRQIMPPPSTADAVQPAEAVQPADAVAHGVDEVTFAATQVREVAASHAHLWSVRSPETERVVRALEMVRAIDGGACLDVPRLRGGRDVREVVLLEDASRADIAATADGRSGERWPGSLPAPFPATLWTEVRAAEVLDVRGDSVGVTGRHELTASPAMLILGDESFRVLAHGGPWPLEERWWDARRRRRAARLQLLVRERTGQDETVYLVHLEKGRWSAVARYD